MAVLCDLLKNKIAISCLRTSTGNYFLLRRINISGKKILETKYHETYRLISSPEDDQVEDPRTDESWLYNRISKAQYICI